MFAKVALLGLAAVTRASYAAESATCTGSADPVEPGCYEGQAGALGLKEDVKVNVKSFASGKGKMDLSGSGIKSFTCTDHAFSKAGQDISVDVSDCVPSEVIVSDVQYCSDSDQIKVTVKDKSVPIPVSALLSKVTCASDALESATCTGSADLVGPGCYVGQVRALGLKEDVIVRVDPRGNGKMDLAGNYKADQPGYWSCVDAAFSQVGQHISVNVSFCIPSKVIVSDVQYCSDSDQMKVTVQDPSVPVPLSGLLSKGMCTDAATVVV